jgi:hypothetical protein
LSVLRQAQCAAVDKLRKAMTASDEAFENAEFHASKIALTIMGRAPCARFGRHRAASHNTYVGRDATTFCIRCVRFHRIASINARSCKRKYLFQKATEAVHTCFVGMLILSMVCFACEKGPAKDGRHRQVFDYDAVLIIYDGSNRE